MIIPLTGMYPHEYVLDDPTIHMVGTSFLNGQSGPARTEYLHVGIEFSIRSESDVYSHTLYVHRTRMPLRLFPRVTAALK